MKRVLIIIFQLFSVHAVYAQAFNTVEHVDINDIKAATLVHGDMWWDTDIIQQACEYPKGSGKHVQYVSALWVGGYDSQQQLHISAQTYRQNGNDFWPGPLDNATDSCTYASSADWAKIWKVNKSTIDSFRATATHTASNTPAVILEWPAKGNTNARGNNNAILQISEDMAPFVDVNNDGVYNALQGDYPAIKGHQYLWWIFNDNGTEHGETNGLPLKIEVRSNAFAFDTVGTLASTIFYEFKVKNKSSNDYDSTVIGLRSDIDLGYGYDDFIGFDSVHRMGIGYNGTYPDGPAGLSSAYGASIPMSAVAMLKLPGDTAGTLKPAGSFMYYNNDFTGKGNPTNAQEKYNYLTSRFRDSTHLQHNSVDVNYAYDGEIGVPGEWSECMDNNTPGDRRFVISSNKFTLAAGATETIAMALIITPPDSNNGCPSTGFNKIKAMADTIFGLYNDLPTVGVPSVSSNAAKLKIYPNPASSVLFIERPATTAAESVQVYDGLGRVVPVSVEKENNLLRLDIKNMVPGVYMIQYQSGAVYSSGIFVKN